MKVLLLIAVFSVTIEIIVKADDSKPACDTLAQCLSDAVVERTSCDAITAAINAKWPPKYNEHQQSVQDKVAKINQLNSAKRDKKIKCLQDSVNTTIISCNQTRKDQCADFVTAHKPRPKRQVANATHANATVTATAAAKAKALADAKAKKAEAAKEAAAKKEADKQERAKLQNDLKECQKSVALRESQCSQLAGCCSENTICDWKYQTDPDFAQLANLNIALQLENRATICPAPAPVAAAAAPPPTPNASSPTATASPPPVTPGATPQV